MVVAKKLTLKKIITAQLLISRWSPIQVTNPTRPGLNSELVCLPSLFLAKIPLKLAAVFSISSKVHLELIVVSSAGGGTSLPVLADLHAGISFAKRSLLRTLLDCFARCPITCIQRSRADISEWRRTKWWFLACVGPLNLKLLRYTKKWTALYAWRARSLTAWEYWAWDAKVRTLNATSPCVSRPKNNNTVYFEFLYYSVCFVCDNSIRKSDFCSETKTHSRECLCWYPNETGRGFLPRLG